MTISFWISDPGAAVAFESWDPDLEPERFASGVGHNILELAKRIETLGEPVAVGRDRLPIGTPVVFLLKDAYSSRVALRYALRAIRRAHGHFAVVRSDTPTKSVFPIRPTYEFVATQGSVIGGWQRWVPPLPQRGLRPRRSERVGRLESLVLKANPENVPAQVSAVEWKRALGDRGIRWQVDTPSGTDGSDQTWHDFTDVDAVLCAPHPAAERDPARKPATRLINAWVAGCVPLAAREPAYLELGNDGRDVLFFDDLDECLEILDALRANPGMLRTLERGVADRGAEFSPRRISRLWLDAMLDLKAAARSTGWPVRRRIAITEKRLAHAFHEAADLVPGSRR